jgi:hypothetical protein
MSWLATIGVGILTAIIGAFGTGAMGGLCVNWFRVSSREGGSAFFVIYLGLLGGVIGLIAGMVSARIVAGGVAPSFLKGLGVGAGSAVGLLLIATFICWLVADLPTTVEGKPAELHAEVRCPPSFSIPSDATPEHWYAHIDTRTRRATSRGILRVAESRQEDGRWVIPMTLGLDTSVRQKLLYVRFGKDADVQLFTPIFPSRPGQQHRTWSEWLDGSWDPGKPRPAPEDRFELRFRVEAEPTTEPLRVPSGPSEAELKAQAGAQETAALAALTPESPLEDCLKFTHHSQPEERRLLAGTVIARRPAVVSEMSAQIRSSDKETADRAMRALAFIKPLSAELAAPTAEVGERIIAALRTFNASKPADDPTHQGAADIFVLFTSWFQGHRALHECAGVDGRAQLKEILELAQQREDSDTLKNHVARVAKFYMAEWNAEPVLK